MSAHLRRIKPRHVNRSVPIRPANADLRAREYLTPAEVEKLIKATRDGRYGHRDATLILIAFRHGLRAFEICGLEWSQVEFGRSASLHVRRSRTASHRFTRFAATRSARCAGFAGNFPIVGMCSPPSAEFL
jgi:integrase